MSLPYFCFSFSCFYFLSSNIATDYISRVTGIQGKWEWEWKRNGNLHKLLLFIGFFKSRVARPLFFFPSKYKRKKVVWLRKTRILYHVVRFTELYKPNHWYTIVVKFFLLHNALSNKRPCNAVYQLTSFVIYYNYTIFYLAYLTLTVWVCCNCFKIWLNNLKFQYRNNRHLWLKYAINSAPIALMKTCGICCNLSQLSLFFTSEIYRTLCVKPGYRLVQHRSHSEVPAL